MNSCSPSPDLVGFSPGNQERGQSTYWRRGNSRSKKKILMEKAAFTDDESLLSFDPSEWICFSPSALSLISDDLPPLSASNAAEAAKKKDEESERNDSKGAHIEDNGRPMISNLDRRTCLSTICTNRGTDGQGGIAKPRGKENKQTSDTPRQTPLPSAKNSQHIMAKNVSTIRFGRRATSPRRGQKLRKSSSDVFKVESSSIHCTNRSQSFISSSSKRIAPSSSESSSISLPLSIPLPSSLTSTSSLSLSSSSSSCISSSMATSVVTPSTSSPAIGSSSPPKSLALLLSITSKPSSPSFSLRPSSSVSSSIIPLGAFLSRSVGSLTTSSSMSSSSLASSSVRSGKISMQPSVIPTSCGSIGCSFLGHFSKLKVSFCSGSRRSYYVPLTPGNAVREDNCPSSRFCPVKPYQVNSKMAPSCVSDYVSATSDKSLRRQRKHPIMPNHQYSRRLMPMNINRLAEPSAKTMRSPSNLMNSMQKHGADNGGISYSMSKEPGFESIPASAKLSLSYGRYRNLKYHRCPQRSTSRNIGRLAEPSAMCSPSNLMKKPGRTMPMYARGDRRYMIHPDVRVVPIFNIVSRCIRPTSRRASYTI
ncbi:hypothetical protein KP509_06G046600 [Ceratopteris richardii]|uniref:Uncharacterized protein n=1 Tax=Ceratopteris richardii TaxID=49495 RepID=A0A8T2UHT2_CERRI|nr:hypothetical protein KP509_06G046600 [Ceratopteris richardii]